MYVSLKKKEVTFDQKSALKLAGLGADDDSPAARLIASAFDITEHCGSFDAVRHLPTEHQDAMRNGLVDSSVSGLHKFASIGSRDEAEYAFLVVRQLHARNLDLRWRVCGSGNIFSVGKKDF